MSNIRKKLVSQEAFIKTSYIMAGASVVGLVANDIMYLAHIISSELMIFITLNLSWLALTFAAYGNVISSQVNKKVENLDTKSLETDELKVGK